MHAQSTTFMLEDSQGKTHTVIFSYKLFSEFQSNRCGYVLRVSDFVVAESKTLQINITGPNGYGLDYGDEYFFYAVIDP